MASKRKLKTKSTATVDHEQNREPPLFHVDLNAPPASYGFFKIQGHERSLWHASDNFFISPPRDRRWIEVVTAFRHAWPVLLATLDVSCDGKAAVRYGYGISSEISC